MTLITHYLAAASGAALTLLVMMLFQVGKQADE
jgi:hypothetical protein